MYFFYRRPSSLRFEKIVSITTQKKALATPYTEFHSITFLFVCTIEMFFEQTAKSVNYT